VVLLEYWVRGSSSRGERADGRSSEGKQDPQLSIKEAFVAGSVPSFAQCCITRGCSEEEGLCQGWFLSL